MRSARSHPLLGRGQVICLINGMACRHPNYRARLIAGSPDIDQFP